VEEYDTAREVIDYDIIRYRRLACWRTRLETDRQTLNTMPLHEYIVYANDPHCYIILKYLSCVNPRNQTYISHKVRGPTDKPMYRFVYVQWGGGWGVGCCCNFYHNKHLKVNRTSNTESSPMEYYVMSTGKELPTFRRILVWYFFRVKQYKKWERSVSINIKCFLTVTLPPYNIQFYKCTAVTLLSDIRFTLHCRNPHERRKHYVLKINH